MNLLYVTLAAQMNAKHILHGQWKSLESFENITRGVCCFYSDLCLGNPSSTGTHFLSFVWVMYVCKALAVMSVSVEDSLFLSIIIILSTSFTSVASVLENVKYWL